MPVGSEFLLIAGLAGFGFLLYGLCCREARMYCVAGLGSPLVLKKRRGFCYVFLRFVGEGCCGVIARL